MSVAHNVKELVSKEHKASHLLLLELCNMLLQTQCRRERDSLRLLMMVRGLLWRQRVQEVGWSVLLVQQRGCCWWRKQVG